jgi:capsular exopolysaccharide synthesis family protein
MPDLVFDRRLVSLTDPGSFAAEQFQGLRMAIERLPLDGAARVVAVTSPGAGDGKTLTAINLAVALSRGGRARVLLIDADMRQPAIAARLGLPVIESPGLADLLADETMDIDKVAHAVTSASLSLIGPGTRNGPVHRVLRTERLQSVLDAARRRYDFVVIDTPPLLPVFDAVQLSRAADAVLVVVSARKTPRKLLGEALGRLESSRVLGIVFNNDDRPLFGYYDRKHYGGYFTDRAAGAQE